MTGRLQRISRTLALTGVILSGVATTAADAAEFSYDDWTLILARYVDDDGLVDYASLAAEREPLDRFLEQIETLGPESSPETFPTRDHQLAYYINAYNALVFDGVVGLDADADSVWGFTGTGYGFFVRMKVMVDGQKMSLKKLEDDLIREGFKDPRIHAALNCASLGCPKLPREPFLPERLDDQLEAEMRKFVNEDRNCSLDQSSKTATLSKIFDWFRKDFEEYEQSRGGGDLRTYINRFRPAGAQIPADYEITFAKYDKGLNRQ